MAATTDAPEESTALEETKPLKLDVDVEKVSTCERKVKVTVPRDDIERAFEEAIGDLMPTALLPGFRPGRAPRRLVSSRFKSELKDQVRSKLLTDAMSQVTEEQKLAPISEPDLDLEAVIMPDEGPMTFEFGIEVRPEFDLPKWKGLSIKRPSREITEADVDEALANILRDRSRLVPFSGSPAPGDLIVANIRFLHGGKVLSHAEEVEMVVRSKLSFADAELPGFIALMTKSKPGDTVTATVTISAEAAVEELRGKDVSLELEVLEVKKLDPPELTPALLAELGDFEAADDLRNAVRRQLENQLEWHRRRQVRQQV